MKQEVFSLHSFPENPIQAEKAAVNKLVSLIKKSLDKNQPTLLLLSGGTWISPLNQVNLLNLKFSHPEMLTVTALDERVDLGPENNFPKIVGTKLISSLINSGANFISTLSKSNDAAGYSGKIINDHLNEYLLRNPNAVLIATAGVGGSNNVPGHIAGIEPREKDDFKFLFQDSEVLYRGYIAKNLKPEFRATATFTLLDKVNHFVLLILDPEKKRSSLDQILSDDPIPLNESPCVYFRHRPNTTIYTDISV